MVLRGPMRATSTAAAYAIEATQQLRLFCILRLYRCDAPMSTNVHVWSCRHMPGTSRRHRQGLRFHVLSTARQHAAGAGLGVEQGQREMRVGQKMSRLITRNVIIMALTLVVCLPLLQGWGQGRGAVLAEGLRTVVAVYAQQGLQTTQVRQARVKTCPHPPLGERAPHAVIPATRQLMQRWNSTPLWTAACMVASSRCSSVAAWS